MSEDNPPIVDVPLEPWRQARIIRQAVSVARLRLLYLDSRKRRTVDPAASVAADLLMSRVRASLVRMEEQLSQLETRIQEEEEP